MEEFKLFPTNTYVNGKHEMTEGRGNYSLRVAVDRSEIILGVGDNGLKSLESKTLKLPFLDARPNWREAPKLVCQAAEALEEGVSKGRNVSVKTTYMAAKDAREHSYTTLTVPDLRTWAKLYQQESIYNNNQLFDMGLEQSAPQNKEEVSYRTEMKACAHRLSRALTALADTKEGKK